MSERRITPTKQPNPGSAAAIKQGCTCAVMDNYNGKGFMLEGEIRFWISVGCPLHCPSDQTKERLAAEKGVKRG